MRAHAASLGTWLKICWRSGWLDGTLDRVFTEMLQDTARTAEGVDTVVRMKRWRGEQRLAVPYGPRAVALGLGPIHHRQRRGVRAPLLTELPERRDGAHRRRLTPLPETTPPPVPEAPEPTTPTQFVAAAGPTSEERRATERESNRRRRAPIPTTRSGLNLQDPDPDWANRRGARGQGNHPPHGPPDPEPPPEDERPS